MPSTIEKCKLFRIKHTTVLESETFLRNKHKTEFFEIKCTFFGRKENTITYYLTNLEVFIDKLLKQKVMSIYLVIFFVLPIFYTRNLFYCEKKLLRVRLIMKELPNFNFFIQEINKSW